MAIRLVLEVHVTHRANGKAFSAESTFLVPINPAEDEAFFDGWTEGLSVSLAERFQEGESRLEIFAAKYKVDDLGSHALLEASTLVAVNDPARWQWREVTTRYNGQGM